MKLDNEKIKDIFLSGMGIAVYHLFLKKSQYWDQKKIEKYQVKKLRKVLISANKNIKFYKEIFESIGFEPNKFNKLDDLKKIPILTKNIAKERALDLHNLSEIRTAIELKSSGTTGEPFVTYGSKWHWIFEQAVMWRHWKWAKYKFRDLIVSVRGYVPKEGQVLWKKEKLRNFFFLSAYHISKENINLYVDKINETKPKYLRGYPSSLYILARFIKELKIDVFHPKAIFTASEALTDNKRELIESVFKAKVFDWYGLSEPAILISECEKGKYHINSEYGYCELIKDESLLDNQRRIVATSLHNIAMPLIRYDTKDIAVVDDTCSQDCECGRTLPTIKKILGRKDDFLFGDEGRILPSVNFYTLFYSVEGISGFQLIQEKLNEIEVRLETLELFNDKSFEELKLGLVGRIGDNINIKYTLNKGFVQSREGKKPVVIQKVKH